jgi:hypothetical protein
VGPARRIDVFAHNLSGVVDAEWPRLDRVWHCDLREHTVVEQEPVWQLERGHVGVIAVHTNDLSLIVHPRGEGSLGAGKIGHGEGLFVLQETVEGSSIIDVAAHGPGMIVDTEDDGERADTGGIDGGENAVVRHEPMAPDTDVVLVLARGYLVGPS